MTNGSPHCSDSSWSRAIFVVLFGDSEANRDIHADDTTAGYQRLYVLLSTIFTPDACPSCLNPPSLCWLGTGTELYWLAYFVHCPHF